MTSPPDTNSLAYRIAAAEQERDEIIRAWGTDDAQPFDDETLRALDALLEKLYKIRDAH